MTVDYQRVRRVSRAVARKICPRHADDLASLVLLTVLEREELAGPPLRTVAWRAAVRLRQAESGATASWRAPAMGFALELPAALPSNDNLDALIWQARLRERMTEVAREAKLTEALALLLDGPDAPHVADTERSRRYHQRFRLRALLRNDPILHQLLTEGP